MALKIRKITPGKIVKGRFIPLPKKKANSSRKANPYEITKPGRQGERISMGYINIKTLSGARKIAKRLADEEKGPMLIEKVNSRGISIIVERVKA